MSNSDNISIFHFRFPFLSYLYGTLKSFIWNWAIGRESSSFISDIRSNSILFSIMYVCASDLFLTELILRCADIDLSGDWILISLSTFFASLVSFSVADLWKTVSCEIGVSTLVFIPLCFGSISKEISKFMSWNSLEKYHFYQNTYWPRKESYYL